MERQSFSSCDIAMALAASSFCIFLNNRVTSIWLVTSSLVLLTFLQSSQQIYLQQSVFTQSNIEYFI